MDAIRSNAFDTSFTIEDVDDSRLRELYPHLRCAPGTTGLRQPDGAILDPRRFVVAQLALLAKAGGKHLQDRVKAIRDGASAVTLDTSSHGQIRASKVVAAAGANIYFDRLLPRQLEIKVIGLTVALARVPADTKSFPTLMYSVIVSEAPFSGRSRPGSTAGVTLTRFRRSALYSSSSTPVSP